MALDAATLTERLELLIDKYDVPSTSVAVLVDGELVTAAAGLVNRPAGIETSTDAVYQIGSISKVYTTCLVLRLVERGVLDLDVPVRHLPARAEALRPRRHREGHVAAPAHATPAASTATTSRTPVAATTVSRSTSRPAPSCLSSSPSAPATPTATPAS